MLFLNFRTYLDDTLQNLKEDFNYKSRLSNDICNLRKQININ